MLRLRALACCIVMTTLVAGCDASAASQDDASPNPSIQTKDYGPGALCAGYRIKPGERSAWWRSHMYVLNLRQQWTVNPVSFIVQYRLEGGQAGSTTVDSEMAAFIKDIHAEKEGLAFWEEVNRALVRRLKQTVPKVERINSYVLVGGSSAIPIWRASAVLWQREALCTDGGQCEAFFFRVPRLRWEGDAIYDLRVAMQLKKDGKLLDYLKVYDEITRLLAEPSYRQKNFNEIAPGLKETLSATFPESVENFGIQALMHRGGDERAQYENDEPVEWFMNFEGINEPPGPPAPLETGAPHWSVQH